ncbi:MAG: HPP family protein [bacterium]
MFKAKDIMIKNVITVKKETPIYKAIKLLAEKNITGLPVVSDDMHLLGIITEKDMMKLMYDPDIEYCQVADLMTSKVVYFDENDKIQDVCQKLMENNFRRVPILSEGKVVGIISRSDIIKFILLKTLKPAKNKSTFDH